MYNLMTLMQHNFLDLWYHGVSGLPRASKPQSHSRPSPCPGGSDYGPFPTSVARLRIAIQPDETELPLGVPIIEDTVVEHPEGFSAELRLATFFSNPAGVRVGDDMARVTIVDNDCEFEARCSVTG